VTACRVAIVITLIFGVQVDVFHFPLKGWWLIAGLTWVVYRQSLAGPMPSNFVTRQALDRAP
jgi:hypothetical protein